MIAWQIKTKKDNKTSQTVRDLSIQAMHQIWIGELHQLYENKVKNGGSYEEIKLHRFFQVLANTTDREKLYLENIELGQLMSQLHLYNSRPPVARNKDGNIN